MMMTLVLQLIVVVLNFIGTRAESWKFETGNVKVQNSTVDSDEAGAITISTGSITLAGGAIDFDNENLSTTGTIMGFVDNDTTVATELSLRVKLGDLIRSIQWLRYGSQVLVWKNSEQASGVLGCLRITRDDVGH